MDKFFPIFILILLFNGIIFGQTYTYSGKLLDQNNSAPIEYGHVYLKGKPNGTLSSIDGNFSLSNISENDTLIISCVGYEPLAFKYHKQLKKNIHLTPRIYNLKSTEIKSGKSKMLKAGFLLSRIEKDKIGGSYHALISDGQNFINTSAQTGIFVENVGKKVGLIQNVAFFLHKEGVANTPFRLRLYAVNKDGKPANDLVNQNIIVTHGKNDAWVTIELSNYQIELSNYQIELSNYQIEFPEDGFFITMEWLQTNNKAFTYKSKRKKFLSKSEKEKLIKESYLKLDFMGFGQALGYYEMDEKRASWHKSIIQEWSDHKSSSVPMIRCEIKIWE